MKKPALQYLWLVSLVAVVVACQTTGDASQASPPDGPVSTRPAVLEGDLPFAEIVNEEGGAIAIHGEVAYTNPFFTIGVAEPVIILEDQAGFVDRDRDFIFPVESQVLGQITSDFYTSPFTYSLALPLEPKGSLRDVDQDSEADNGVMVYAIAYWTNTWGDAYLEKRDQSGGGWSSAYASTRVSDARDMYLEVYGGTYLIFAADEDQGFPSGFGEDERLFTADDPIVQLPAGWTVVNLDSEPFTFDRSRKPQIDLHEPESIALDDFSSLGYTEAFEAMLEKMRTEYAFTEYKEIDWDMLAEAYLPRFEQAQANSDAPAYYLALRDFLWSIPDGHIGMDLTVLGGAFTREVSGGLGMAIQELSDGRFLVSYLKSGGPAAEAGIELGAEILELEGVPIANAVMDTVPWSSPFSTPHALRLEQARYVLRFPLGTQVSIRYQNRDNAPEEVQLNTIQEWESFDASSPFVDATGVELPVEFELLENNFGYVAIKDFFDNELLTIQLWERMISDLNEKNVPGLVIDLRLNGGGSGYLADQMAAYFFDEEIEAGNTGYFDRSSNGFYADPGDAERLFPPREELRYHGSIAVIVGPACASACEFFAYDMTLQERAVILGHNPTAGLGGSVEDFLMPAGLSVRFTIGRAVDASGVIHIEGRGVVPEVHLPFDEAAFEAALDGTMDVLMEHAIEIVSRPRGAGITPSGPPNFGTSLEVDQALQEDAPFLEDLALEVYTEELYQPATQVYNIPLGRSRTAIWLAGWCAAPEQFESNWESIQLLMVLDSQEVPLGDFTLYEGTAGDQLCRFYFTALSNWPPGEHTLINEMTFLRDLSDGLSPEIYAEGVRTYEYHVFVSE